MRHCDVEYSSGMDGAVKSADPRLICRFTTYDQEASSATMSFRISSRFVVNVTINNTQIDGIRGFPFSAVLPSVRTAASPNQAGLFSYAASDVMWRCRCDFATGSTLTAPDAT